MSTVRRILIGLSDQDWIFANAGKLVADSVEQQLSSDLTMADEHRGMIGRLSFLPRKSARDSTSGSTQPAVSDTNIYTVRDMLLHTFVVHFLNCILCADQSVGSSKTNSIAMECTD